MTDDLALNDPQLAGSLAADRQFCRDRRSYPPLPSEAPAVTVARHMGEAFGEAISSEQNKPNRLQS